MGKIVAGVSLLVLSFGIANADEFFAQITKVEGNKVTAKIVKLDKGSFKKGGKGKGGFKDFFKDAETKTFTVTSTTKIVKRGKFDPETKKAETTPLEDGLKNKLFTEASEEKPLRGTISTNDSGDVTQISVGGGRGGFKGGFNKKKKKNETGF